MFGAVQPGSEHTALATDPEIDWPIEGEPVLSDRDAAAPTLEQVRAAGLLPTWDDTRAFADELRARVQG